MSRASSNSKDALEAAYKKTLARLETIKSHLKSAPRADRLKGKVCVVTGVNSLKGIGRASAILYAHEGAQHLYLLDFDGSNLPELEKTIGERYPDVKVTTIQADATDEGAILGVCERALKEEGRLDVFFANAGIVSALSIHDLEGAQFMKTMRVNTLSVFLAIKYASEAMKKTNPGKGKNESGGSIIATASVAGLKSGAGPTDYSASKSAVISMAQTAAYQLVGTNIRVNAICPGMIETGMTEFQFEYARQRGTVGKMGQLNPMRRYGVAEEIASMALFLASDEASYVNGQAMVVDGGLSASMPVVPGKLA